MTETPLAILDDQLLDGLQFCIAVYDLYDHVRDGPNGLERIRLLRDETAKKLIEELIPISRYVQARYEAGNRFKIRWIKGSQPYDAILYSSGDWVHKGGHPAEIHLEVTTSVHQNDYLAREQFHKEGGTFGPNVIERDMKTREITAQPYVYINDERGTQLAEQITHRIIEKTEKTYPDGTMLVVNCVQTGLVLEDEWHHAVQIVKAKKLVFKFREIILLDSHNRYPPASLYSCAE